MAFTLLGSVSLALGISASVAHITAPYSSVGLGWGRGRKTKELPRKDFQVQICVE